MRNENKFSTQKVREIFLMRAPPPLPSPPFFIQKTETKFILRERQNSFADAADTDNNYKITILLFIKE